VEVEESGIERQWNASMYKFYGNVRLKENEKCLKFGQQLCLPAPEHPNKERVLPKKSSQILTQIG